MTSREQQRVHFLNEQGYENAVLSPLIPDASNRCYFRLKHIEPQLMLMDAPPETENTGQFIAVTKLFAQLGARVPTLHGFDNENGFVLLEDLGNATFTHLLASESNEQELYQTATDALIDFQSTSIQSSLSTHLPAYDLALCIREAILFCEWYLPAALGRRLSEDEKSEFVEVITTLFNKTSSTNSIVVHRDFHVDNLLLVDNECAFLDYQDAVMGSAAYDLVSLLEDARRDIDPDVKTTMWLHWLSHQNQSAENAEYDFRFWGAQRHCKVAGIFVRLWLRDGKPVYLEHLDRVLNQLRESVNHQEMQPLADWLSRFLGPVKHTKFNGEESDLRKLISATA